MFVNNNPGKVYQAATEGHSGKLAYKWLEKPLHHVQLDLSSGRNDFNLYGTLEYRHKGTTQQEAKRTAQKSFEKAAEVLSKQAVATSIEPYMQDGRLIFEGENGTRLALSNGGGEEGDTQLQITTGYLEKSDGSRQVLLPSLELNESTFNNALNDTLGALATATLVTYEDIARKPQPEYSVPVTPPNPKIAGNLPEAYGESELQEVATNEEKLSKPKVTFEDIGGQEELKQNLKKLAAAIAHPEIYKSWGAESAKGILLHGPPGTGKTLAARAVAGEAGVPFFSASGSEFVEQFVGVGASRVRELFAEAKSNAPSILFIDEIDAIGRRRGSGDSSGNQEYAQTLNQILSEMDGFEQDSGVTVLATTNREDVLDPALLRPGRFDKSIEVGLPDAVGRRDIFNIHSRKVNEVAGRELFGDDIDIDEIAHQTDGQSGAEIAEVIRRVLEEKAFQEITEGVRPSPVSMQEIIDGFDSLRAQSKTNSNPIGFRFKKPVNNPSSLRPGKVA